MRIISTLLLLVGACLAPSTGTDRTTVTSDGDTDRDTDDGRRTEPNVVELPAIGPDTRPEAFRCGDGRTAHDDADGGRYCMRDGVRDGLAARWNQDGRLIELLSYADGKLHGLTRSWNADGALVEETDYDAGERHGRFVRYHATGKPAVEGGYRRGAEHGTWITAAPDGARLELVTYDRGVKTGPYKTWHPGGILAVEGETLRGDPHGTWTWYSEKGTPTKRETFDQSVRHGPATYWSHGGSKWKEGRYQRGREDGTWHYWHPSGASAGVRTYRAGRRHGPWTELFEDGRPKVEATYVDGVRDGLYREWRDDGTPLVVGGYARGVKRGEWLEYRAERARDYCPSRGEEESVRIGDAGGGSCEALAERAHARGRYDAEARRDGAWRFWLDGWPSGLVEEEVYDHGKPKAGSRWTLRWDNGKRRQEVRFDEAGHLGSLRSYWPNGRRWMTANYKRVAQMFEGVEEENDVAVGTSYGWGPSGRPLWIARTDQRGIASGKQESWYDNGKRRSVEVYTVRNGRPIATGTWITWFENGNKESVKQYKVVDGASVRTGVWLFYDDSGKLIRRERYEGGNRIVEPTR